MSCVGSVLMKTPLIHGASKGIMASSAGCWSSHYSTEVRPGSEVGRKARMDGVTGDIAHKVPNLTAMKRGTGYRSSFSGTVTTVFGATGCVGKIVVSRLGKIGSQIIIPYRGDEYFTRGLKVSGDLGQVLFTNFHLRDEESIRKAMKYSDNVINLIGREYETLNFKFEDVNVQGPRLLAKIARESGVKNFIHVSALNASENPQRLFSRHGSKWLKTKYLGEKAVFEEFPEAIIFRPSDLYGHNDYFLRHFMAWHRKGAWWHGCRRPIPLWKKGNCSVKAPLHMSDLVSGMMAALETPEAKGKIFEAYGPGRFLLSDLCDWMHEVMHKDREDFGYKRVDLRFDYTPFMKAALLQSLTPLGQKNWAAPTIDKLERIQLTDEVQGLPNLVDLGVKASRVQDAMPFELDVYRAFRYIRYFSFMEKPVIHPLKELTRLEENALMVEEANKGLILHYLGLKQ